MGPLPRAVLMACLQVLHWLLLVTAALMLILLIVQQLRGDPGATPLQLGLGAVVMAVGGWLAGKGAAWVGRMSGIG